MMPSYCDGYFLKISYTDGETVFSVAMVIIEYLHHNHSLLNDIANPGSDEVQQNVHASFSSFFDIDGGLTDSFYTLPHKVDIDL